MNKISIICCINNVDKYNEYTKKSFSALHDVEFIEIDNLDNKYSITQAYNIGKKQATGKYLVFAHQDIRMLDSVDKFEKGLDDIFSLEEVGLVGFAGSKCIRNVEWWSTPPLYGKVKHWEGDLTFNKVNLFEEVIVVDGLGFVIPNRIKSIFNFDESFKWFHSYDLDVCLTLHFLGYKIGVFEFYMQHYPSGRFYGENWQESCEVFYNKWSNKLPITI